MTNQTEIEEKIQARTAERQSVIDQHTAKKREVEQMVSQFNEYTSQCAAKVAHLGGCIEELQSLLPKPEEPVTPENVSPT